MANQTTTSKIAPKAEAGVTLSSKQGILGLYVVLSLAYILMTLLLPPDKKVLVKYQVSPASIRILSLVVTLPLVAIWGLGFYGYYRYHSYTTSIKNTRDGRNHQLISNGLLILALSLPINNIISNLLTYYGRLNPGFLASSVIIGNYITIAIYLTAFLLLYKGANGLVHITGQNLRQRGEIYLMMIFTVVVAAFYYLSLTNPARQFPASGGTTAAYFLPDWLIVTTILIPYTIMWYLGTMAAYRLWLYRNRVSGEIYRTAFTRVAIGLGMVVALQMVLRFLVTIVTLLDKLALKYLLLIIYVLLIFIGVGYWFIASGAKRLKRIEEV